MIRKEDIFLYVWFKWLLLKEWYYIMNLLIGNLNYMKIKLNALFLEINKKKILYNKDIMRNINFLIEGNYFFSKIRDIFSFCFFYIYHYNLLL